MSMLPDGYWLRPATMDDLDAAVDITNAYSIAAIGEGDITVARLRMFWTEPDRNLATDNWFIIAPDGQPVAYADFSAYDQYQNCELDYAILPGHHRPGLARTIYDVAEARARLAIPLAPESAPVTLATGVWSNNQADAALLSERGYRQDRVWNRMLIEMTELPPEPTWPDGFSLRNLMPDEADLVHQAWEDAQRDEFGFSSLSPAEFRTYLIEEEENFDPSLWFLAIDDATGAIAGYTLCRWERPGNPDTGHIRYVAVRRQYRRRGLGHALLVHTFREFYRRGKPKVGLAVDSTSLTGADRLYERAGMRATQQMHIFLKTLRP